MLTDHRNLPYVLAPLALRAKSLRHVLSKAHRWAIHLSRFEFVIDRIEGINNVFADALTDWSKKIPEKHVATVQNGSGVVRRYCTDSSGHEKVKHVKYKEGARKI